MVTGMRASATDARTNASFHVHIAVSSSSSICSSRLIRVSCHPLDVLHRIGGLSNLAHPV